MGHGRGVTRRIALAARNNALWCAVCRSHDDLVAGCIVNVTGEVAGLSNVFSVDGEDARAWRGVAAAAARVAPGRALVGWASGDGVASARSAGFEVTGPLTVWIR